MRKHLSRNCAIALPVMQKETTEKIATQHKNVDQSTSSKENSKMHDELDQLMKESQTLMTKLMKESGERKQIAGSAQIMDEQWINSKGILCINSESQEQLV